MSRVRDLGNILREASDSLNTFNEVASALNYDPNFATTITNAISEKASTGKAIAMAIVFGG